MISSIMFVVGLFIFSLEIDLSAISRPEFANTQEVIKLSQAEAGRARDRASAENKAACESWCKDNKPECDHCSTLRNCGTGFKNIKSWTGFGDNWHACAKTGGRSINVMWPGNSAARPEHRVLVVSLDGHYGYKTRGGIEWFCEDYFSGNNKKSEVLCISSYAAISTRSNKLSDNIAELAVEMKKRAELILKLYW